MMSSNKVEDRDFVYIACHTIHRCTSVLSIHQELRRLPPTSSGPHSAISGILESPYLLSPSKLQIRCTKRMGSESQNSIP